MIDSKHLDLLRDYKKNIEQELLSFCNDILALLDSNLLPQASNAESKVFFLKMKGDYHRYISEFAQGDAHQQAADKAHDAYKSATDGANADLKTTHPIRLGNLLFSHLLYCYQSLTNHFPFDIHSMNKYFTISIISYIYYSKRSNYIIKYRNSPCNPLKIYFLAFLGVNYLD